MSPIFARRFNRVDHLVERLLAESIHDARTVDGDPGDLIPNLVKNVGVVPFIFGYLVLRRVGCRFLCHFFSPFVFETKLSQAMSELHEVIPAGFFQLKASTRLSAKWHAT